MSRIKHAMAVFFIAMICFATEVHAQGDPSVLRAIVEQLNTMQAKSIGVHGIWIRHGEFQLERHNVRHSFGSPVREWSNNERAGAETIASSLRLPVEFCRQECEMRPDSIWTVAVGTVRDIATGRIAVPVQVEGSEGTTASFKVVYEMILQRAEGNGWSVVEVLPGASSDAVSCQELYGHSCEEEKRRKAEES